MHVADGAPRSDSGRVASNGHASASGLSDCPTRPTAKMAAQPSAADIVSGGFAVLDLVLRFKMGALLLSEPTPCTMPKRPSLKTDSNGDILG